MGHETIPFTVAFDQTVPDEYSEFYVSPPAGSDQTHLKDMKMTPWLALKLLGRATWSVEAYYKARALVEATKPDIAYVHNLYNYMSPSPIAAFKDMGVPVVMRVSDYNMVCPGTRVLRNGKPCFECIERGYANALRYRCHKGSFAATVARVVSMYLHDWAGVYNRVDRFITPSLFMRGVLVRLGVPPERIQHVPSFYAERSAVGVPEGDYILYMGSIARVKGIEVLIRAMALVDTDTRLLLAGRDPDHERRRFETIADDLDLNGRVEFVGFQEKETLSRLIRECRFVVVPSLWPDNCPMAVLEAFAHGKPVVGSNVGGIPEQITEQCGLLFEPGNAFDLAAKMGILMSDASLCRRMGEAGRLRVLREFSPERHCQSLMTVLNGLV